MQCRVMAIGCGEVEVRPRCGWGSVCGDQRPSVQHVIVLLGPVLVVLLLVLLVLVGQ